ncbi:hypothetical protein [Marinimicrobium sp. ARAG 43.8]|uniref:hypothetical protein n=1 Tax=Marinimicrobium sp. ARAG 43.8 TaxID=3418719 RepID=UPI003CF233F5
MPTHTSSQSSTRTQSRLLANGQLQQVQHVRLKVEQDIAFLRHRIDALEAQLRPNQPVIDTYRTMLESRRSVLHWLNEGHIDLAERHVKARHAC